MRIGSLCSGYGGLELAVQSVMGGTMAWVSDIDKGACKILAHRFPDVPNIGDMTAVDWSAVEPVDVLTAGYPCQPFSSAGYRQGDNDERHLWPAVLEAIRSLRPRLTVLENVSGHRSMGFDRVLGDLAEIGFDAEWTSVSASDVGAPHGRERVFVAAYPQGLRGDQGNPPGHPETSLPGRERMGHSPRNLGSALRGWGDLLGRPCPWPLRVGKFTGNAANPAFWEWLMGLPEGWVTDVPGLTHAEQIKALGNGVVPQQGAAALAEMLAWQAAS